MADLLKPSWLFWRRWHADLAPAPRDGSERHVTSLRFVNFPPHLKPTGTAFPRTGRESRLPGTLHAH